MPRRIPDYADCFWLYNMISSLGHSITIVGLIVFFIVIINVLTLNKGKNIFNDQIKN